MRSLPVILLLLVVVLAGLVFVQKPKDFKPVIIPIRFDSDNKTALATQDLRPLVDTPAFFLEAWRLRLMANSTRGFLEDVAGSARKKMVYRPMQRELIGPIQETLKQGWGDCRDYSVIAASTLKAARPEWNVSFFGVDLDHAFKPDFPNHWMLWLETDEGTYLVDPTFSIVGQGEQWVGWKLPI